MYIYVYILFTGCIIIIIIISTADQLHWNELFAYHFILYVSAVCVKEVLYVYVLYST